MFGLLVAVVLLPIGLIAQDRTVPDAVEFGITPMGLATLPMGRPTSINGSVPCSDDFAASMKDNIGGVIWGTYLFDPATTTGFRLRGLKLSAGYNDLSSQFTSSPSQNLGAYDPTTERFVSVNTEQTASYTLPYLHGGLELEFGMGNALWLNIGPVVDVPLSGKSSELEAILSPSNATFLDRTQTRTIAEGTGTLSNVGTRIGFGAGLAYRLVTGPGLFIEPQIGADIGITEVQPGWSPMVLHAGITLGYHGSTQPPAQKEPEPVALPLPEPPAAQPFTASLSIDVVAERGAIPFRREIVARYIPLLPIIFFDQNSPSIADRYRQAAQNGEFSESALPGNAEAAQHQTLNIIGSRLQRDRNVKVTLTGTTSRDEQDRTNLARGRADSVAAYLESVWGIEPRRISVRGQLQPDVPSNSEYAEGLEENRRVEIELGSDEVLNPVQLRSIEPVTEPHEITFRTTSEASKPITEWSVRLASGAVPLDSITGGGAPPATISWNLTQEMREMILRTGAIGYSMTVAGPDGATVSTPSKNIPLQLDTTITVTSSPTKPDNSADFLLVTFDFNSADLTRRGREDLKAIAARIGPSSEVTVVGYTDVLGESTRNRALAEQRAKQVAEQLPKGTSVTYRGANPEEAPYDNHLPEGRFLSRTVRVVVKNPR